MDETDFIKFINIYADAIEIDPGINIERVNPSIFPTYNLMLEVSKLYGTSWWNNYDFCCILIGFIASTSQRPLEYPIHKLLSFVGVGEEHLSVKQRLALYQMGNLHE